MNINDITTQVITRLKGDGYYSELTEKELKRLFNDYLLSEYKKEVQKQTNAIEKDKNKTGKEPIVEDYEQAYALVENKILYLSEELAAATKQDMKDLKYLI